MDTVVRFEDAYIIGVLVGAGGLGSVHLCGRVGEARSSETRELVVKTVRLDAHEHASARVLAELAALQRLDQCVTQAPHMASFFPSLVGSFFDTNRKLARLVMTKMGGRTLAQKRLEHPNNTLSETQVKHYAYEISVALHYLHVVVKITHGDVKPENVLVVENENRTKTVALVDFDQSVSLVRDATTIDTSDATGDDIASISSAAGDDVNRTSSSAAVRDELTAIDDRIEIKGTPEYVTPEQLNGEPVTAKSDWYQLGVLMYELRFAKTPFGSMFGFSQHTFAKIRQGEVTFPAADTTDTLNFVSDTTGTLNLVSESFIHCVESLLVREPGKRLGFEALKKHAFFANVVWKEIL